MADYFNKVINLSVEEKPRMTCSDYFNINSDDIVCDGGEGLLTTIKYAKDSFLAELHNKSDNLEIDYGKGFDRNLLRSENLTAESIDSFTCDYIYYTCSSCGIESNEPHEKCDACGSVYPYNMLYRDNYIITIDFAPLTKIQAEENPFTRNTFNIRTDEEVLALVKEDMGKNVDLKAFDITYEKFSIVLSVDRLSDKIEALSYKKDMKVSADVTFSGVYEELGSVNVSFPFSESDDFVFTWPEIILSDEVLVIEPKSTDNLLATLICDNPLDYTIKWSVSDEETATVDEEGYVDAGKNPGITYVTAEFEFQGKVYSDTCEIRVRVPVESILVSDRKVQLNVGETFEITEKASPNNASIITVTWHTSDESIATIDENGVITAVSSGTVSVYAVSDDGYYKSTCEVIVR